jgi:branched-chain amino acid transport system permease protein
MLNQIISNSLLSSSLYIIIAISFSIIFHTTRFFHFSHAIIFTLGAYYTYFFYKFLNIPLIPSVIIAIFFTTFIGCMTEVIVYKQLRKKNSSSLIMLLSSLGIYFFFQNLISLLFGDDTKSIRSGIIHEGISILGARITSIQIVIISTSIVLVITTAIWMKKSKMGKAMRAVANDSELALVSGVDSNRVILWTFAIGSAMAGLAGILFALDVDMTPTMGMNALMMGVVAMIIGGINNIYGVAMGALLLGFAQHFGVWKISSQWQDAIAFIILFVFLLFRPQGFLGRKIKKAEI